MTNTLYSFVDQGITSTHTQARFDRARNSKLVLSGNRVIKRAKVGQTERELEMLTTARECGVSVPHATQIDDNTLSLQFLPHGETLWDYYQHGRVTTELLAAVKAALLVMWKSGIVHGDLHCNNIMISNGTVYIIDMASSWNASVMVDTFGEDDYSADIKEGIKADQAALLTSMANCRALVK